MSDTFEQNLRDNLAELVQHTQKRFHTLGVVDGLLEAQKLLRDLQMHDASQVILNAAQSRLAAFEADVVAETKLA